ncbi:hypothetical protein BDZ45DRAFT_744997 [Acephala macrosclerotiorum]|nr:hypothetical protein BDZ45DRAFT_744997 [Acephala macrosclerotiorum]
MKISVPNSRRNPIVNLQERDSRETENKQTQHTPLTRIMGVIMETSKDVEVPIPSKAAYEVARKKEAKEKVQTDLKSKDRERGNVSRTLRTTLGSRELSVTLNSKPNTRRRIRSYLQFFHDTGVLRNNNLRMLLNSLSSNAHTLLNPATVSSKPTPVCPTAAIPVPSTASTWSARPSSPTTTSIPRHYVPESATRPIFCHSVTLHTNPTNIRASPCLVPEPCASTRTSVYVPIFSGRRLAIAWTPTPVSLALPSAWK